MRGTASQQSVPLTGITAGPINELEDIRLTSTLHDTTTVAMTMTVDEIAELLVPLIGTDVRAIFDREDTSDRIRDVAFAVPALFAISLGTAHLLQSWGLNPVATLGHSFLRDSQSRPT